MYFVISLIKQHKGIVIILLLSFAAHLWFLTANPGYFNEYGSRDAQKYYEMAHQWIDKGFYGYNQDAPNAYVTPGNPVYLSSILLLAKVIHVQDIFLVKCFNMVLSLGTIFLLYLIGNRLFSNKSVGIITALSFATYLGPYHFFRSMLTEMPSIFFFTLAIYLLVLAYQTNKQSFHIAFGFASAILLMFRPAPAPLLLIAYVLMLQKYGLKEGIRIGLLWWIGPVVVMTPWVIRNYYQFGQSYLFSSHSGNPMLGGTNPFFLQDFKHIAYEVAQRGITQNQMAWERIQNGFTTQFPLWFSWFTVGKTSIMFEQPASYPNYFLYKGWFQNFFWYQHLILVIGGAIFSFVYKKQTAIRYILFSILLYIGISNMFIPSDRYGLFIIPMFCVVFGYGSVTVWNHIKSFASQRALASQN